MSHLGNDIIWIVADNSPFADRSPYRGKAEVRSVIFERLTKGFDKLLLVADEMFVSLNRLVALCDARASLHQLRAFHPSQGAFDPLQALVQLLGS
jgi:hypothetical protein